MHTVAVHLVLTGLQLKAKPGSVTQTDINSLDKPAAHSACLGRAESSSHVQTIRLDNMKSLLQLPTDASF